ncbi:hypothetical protein NFI96_005145, partial [Prochilodus magdalenae]
MDECIMLITTPKQQPGRDLSHPGGRSEWINVGGSTTLTTTPEPPPGSGRHQNQSETMSSGRASGASYRAPCTSSTRDTCTSPLELLWRMILWVLFLQDGKSGRTMGGFTSSTITLGPLSGRTLEPK